MTVLPKGEGGITAGYDGRGQNNISKNINCVKNGETQKRVFWVSPKFEDKSVINSLNTRKNANLNLKLFTIWYTNKF